MSEDIPASGRPPTPRVPCRRGMGARLDAEGVGGPPAVSLLRVLARANVEPARGPRVTSRPRGRLKPRARSADSAENPRAAQARLVRPGPHHAPATDEHLTKERKTDVCPAAATGDFKPDRPAKRERDEHLWLSFRVTEARYFRAA